MIRTISDYIYSLILFGATVLAYLAYFDIISGALSKDGRLAVIIIATFAVLLLINNLWLKVKWGRERKYAKVLSDITEGFSNIHIHSRDSADLTDKKLACVNLCVNLAEAYTIITDTRCHVSIKMLLDGEVEGKTEAKVFTLARSFDKKREKNEVNVDHWIHENTDFAEIYNKIHTQIGDNYFMCNCLPHSLDYRNTSFKIYGNPSKKRLFRYITWPLPYKSTLVVPISPSGKEETPTIIGYLCVDSQNSFAFKKLYDLTLLQGVSDGMYNILLSIQKSGSIPQP